VKLFILENKFNWIGKKKSAQIVVDPWALSGKSKSLFGSPYLDTLSIFPRFIGELYKLNMLSAAIMHRCVVKLLKSKNDEESLECLCKLITTVGSRLEGESDRVVEENKSNNKGTLTVSQRFIFKYPK